MDEANPLPPDASEEARKQILDNETRYRRLVNKPSSDTDWNDEDWSWVETERQKRDVLPELRQHYDTVLDAERAAVRASIEAERANFWQRVTDDMASGVDLPGVDLAALKACPTFADRDRMVFAAGQATLNADNQRLKSENDDLKRQLLGTARPPLNGGQSSAGPTYDEANFMNSLIHRAGRSPSA